MTRTLRGAWSRRGTLLPLFLLTLVVVAGLVSVLGFAEGAGTSAAVAVPLLLLGLVAVPATGRELASVRRGEIALARLRGITGAQLYAILALEPLVVLAGGAVAGVVVGAGTSWVSARAWIDAEVALVGSSAVPAVVGVVAVGLVAVLVGMAGALREPLADQVTVTERPRAASTVTLFWSVLLLVAAGVAVYRAAVAEATDGDWLVLAGPALVGLAVGQVALWLLRLAARVAVPATSGRPLAGFLAARRLARVADAASPLRLVVAACVVAAVSMTGAQQVGDWSSATARVRAGGPVQVPVDGDVYEALSLSRELDPEGRWLMAAAVVPGSGSAQARRVFLDTARYDAVIGDFLAGTGAAGVSAYLDGLGSGEVAAMATGDEVRVTARGVSSREDGTLRPRVTVSYVDDRGEAAEVHLALTLDETGAPVTASAALEHCEAGCVLSALQLHRADGDAVLPWVLTGLDFGGSDALAGSWRATSAGDFGSERGPVTVDDGLMAVPTERPQTAVPESNGPRTPILATTTATWPDGPPLLDSPGGDERPADVLGRLSALPLVEGDGVLADLPLAAAGAPPTVPAAVVMVLAATDTPADVLADLTSQTGTRAVRLADVEEATDEEVGAAQARVYALTALFCLAVAGLVLGASISRARAQHLREVAGLRVIGVDLGVLRRSGRIELWATAVTALLAAALGAVATVHLLLANLNLVTVPLHAVPLEIRVAVAPVVAAAAVAAALVALVGGRSRVVRPDRGRPADLREQSR